MFVLFQILILFNYFSYTAYLPVGEPDFYAAGMKSGRGKQVFNYSFRKFTGTLIFFQNNGHQQTRVNILSILSVHAYLLFTGCKNNQHP